jgi:hypothetical protein
MTSLAKAERAQDSPKSMPAIQYAGWLCENRLAIPKSKPLLEILELAIKAIASTRYRDEKWKHPEFSAFCWLDQQCQFAQDRGVKLNHLFFMNGDYNEIEPPKIQLLPFVQCGKDGCVEGFKPDGKGKWTDCACRRAWIEESKRRKA